MGGIIETTGEVPTEAARRLRALDKHMIPNNTQK